MPVAEPKKRGRRPQNKPERVTLANVKGSPEYKAWLDGLAARTLIPLSVIFRDAIEAWAEDRGLPPAPEGERVRNRGGE